MHYQTQNQWQDNITFTIIKPQAVSKGYIGPILNKISEAGFKISAMKMLHLTRKEAEVSMKFTRSVHFTMTWWNL